VYKCKSFVNNEKSAKPLKGLLKGAPIKLILLAMVTVVAGSMLLGMASATPDPSTDNLVITGNVPDKIKISVSTPLTMDIDPDKDGTSEYNTATRSVTVKQNKPLQGWQVTVADQNTGDGIGHFKQGSSTLTNPLHVLCTYGSASHDVNLDSGGLLLGGTGRPTGTPEVTFRQAGSYNDDPGDWTITAVFTAGYSP
jgi:hypothetical protein